MKLIRKISISALLILSLLALSACAPKLVLDNGKILDTKTDVYYVFAPDAYEAVAISTEIYAIWEQNGVEIAYHAIAELPTEEYLVDEYGSVICAEGIELPELEGFKPVGALVCTNSEIASSIADIKDRSKINAIVNAYVNGESESFENTAVDTLTIKFTSDEFPHFYFNLSIMIEEDGRVYLYDRNIGRYVNVADLLDPYLEGYLDS